MDKEKVWQKKRLGRITASELSDLTSASGKIIDGNVDYVRKKRFQRRHGFCYPIYGKALDLGHQYEPEAVAWWRENMPDKPVVYSVECDEIPFWGVEWAKFGASPDCFADDESYVVEIKCLVSNVGAEFFSDSGTSYADKRKAVLKEHGTQIAGQFLSNPKVNIIYLLKYVYQRDDVDEDVDSPLAPWRGTVFEFTRSEFHLADLRNRIILFDKFIDSEYDAKLLKGTKDGEFSLEITENSAGEVVDSTLVAPGLL